MTGALIAVTVQDAPIREALARIAAVASDLTDVMDEIGSVLVAGTIRRFEQERGPDGQPWKLLSAETVIARAGGRRKVYTQKGTIRKPAARKISGMRILQDKGLLRASITHRPDKDGVEVGTNSIYAAIQQFGGQAGRGKKVTIPARPFLSIDADDQRAILGILRRHFDGIAGIGA